MVLVGVAGFEPATPSSRTSMPCLKSLKNRSWAWLFSWQDRTRARRMGPPVRGVSADGYTADVPKHGVVMLRVSSE